MANSRIQLSSIKQGFPKSRSMLAGNAAYDPSATFLISRVTATGGESSLTFSSIPQTYKSLQIRGVAKNNSASDSSYYIYLNGSGGGNYAMHYIYANGVGVYAGGYSNYTYHVFKGSQSSGVASQYRAASIVDIHDYASSSKNTTLRAIAGNDANTASTDYQVTLTSGLWLNTAAVTSISINAPAGSTWIAGTTFALYGLVG